MLRGLPDWVLQVGMFVGGPALLIFLLRFSIVQFRKLGAFLMIVEERPGWRESQESRQFGRTPPRDDRPTLPGRPDLPQHEPKTLFCSLLKFLACLFALMFFTRGVLFFPMIIAWVIFIIFARKYIMLWKAHKYSALFLTGVSLATVAASFFISPLIRTFLAFLARSAF